MESNTSFEFHHVALFSCIFYLKYNLFTEKYILELEQYETFAIDVYKMIYK